MEKRHTLITKTTRFGIVYLFFIILIALSALLILLFPKAVFIQLRLPSELLNLVIAISAGILGGGVYATKAIYFHLARAKAFRKYERSLFLQPIFGGMFSVVVYLIVRGGIVYDGSHINTFAVLAIGFLSGYCAYHFIDKLSEITSNLFEVELQDNEDSSINRFNKDASL